MGTLLTLNDIVFRRGDFTLQIDHVNLMQGHLYLLQGPNGAGKSTLLHLLALLLPPISGDYRYKGASVKNPQEYQRVRQKITLVEQNPYLFDTTVYQNLAFGLRLRDVCGDLQHRRISHALQLVGLEGFERRQAQSLSGGELRRVALARALVLRPQLLLLDEPTAGLDQEVLPVFERCLRDLPGQGTTVVLASHDAFQSCRLGGSVIMLDGGRIAQMGTVKQTRQEETA